MPLGHHKKPFSSKQKKEQLKAKRERKRNKNDDESDESSEAELHTDKEERPVEVSFKSINRQPVKDVEASQRYNPNRFNLQFLKESPEELRRHKKTASKPLELKGENELEIEIEDVYKPEYNLDIPIRPAWSYGMSKEQVDRQERDYFSKYLEKIFENFKQNELSYFDMNLETWRQLWRVIEISDIILLIVDIRYTALHFSPTFYNYCTSTLKKDVILVLNKIDLVELELVIAWKNYFKRKFPKLHILLFSSAKQIKYKQKRSKVSKKSAQYYDEIEEDQVIKKILAANIYTAQAHRQLYECVKNIVKDQVDLSAWSKFTENLLKQSTSMSLDNEINQTVKGFNELELNNDDTQVMEDLYTSKAERKRFENGFVTIGCCGFPNVGKSSLLNSLNGRKVVSVSRTPGHTKHLQTIFLTKTVRLCDCPGLVFPSLVAKPLQVLAGIYPIAQLQEPYNAIRYLAEHISMIDLLNIRHPSQTNPNEEKETTWSPLDICEAWAIKRGYYTAKASRPDVYRAANELLRMALDGRLCLSLKPRNFLNEKKLWQDHPETKQLKEIVKNVEHLAETNKETYKDEMNKIGESEESSTDENDDEAVQMEEEEDEEEHEEEKKTEPSAINIRQNPYALLDDN